MKKAMGERCKPCLPEIAGWVKLGERGRNAVDAELEQRIETLKAKGKR